VTVLICAIALTHPAKLGAVIVTGVPNAVVVIVVLYVKSLAVRALVFAPATF